VIKDLTIFKVRELLGLPFLFLLLLSQSTYAQNHDKAWLKLMRYRKGILGYKSEVDSKSYFLADDGKTNPESEKQATLTYLNGKKENRCIFPGRYQYFVKTGLLKKKSFAHCKDYMKFLKKIDLDSVSVIFSSYYIDRPASAFGHTLFKFNGSKNKGSDLNDYGVDFSAFVTTKNAFLYGVMGIIGGFNGSFNLMPYFLKLREYNDYDSRDLWEFKINLSEQEKAFFLAHLWDMNKAKFDYYYFSENCSYHVLSFLDAVTVKWDLVERMGTFVTPIDTLLPLFDHAKELVGETYLRPSLKSRLQDNINNLSSHDKKIVRAAFKGEDIKNDLAPLKKSKQARLLDTANQMIDYKYSSQVFLKEGEAAKEIQERKRKLLIMRSQIPFLIKTKKKIKKEKVRISHRTGKLQLGYETTNKSVKRTVLRSRFALHRMQEPLGDLYGDFTLQMGRIEAAYDEEKRKAYLRRFEIAHVKAIRPLTFLDKKLSWDFSVGFKNDDLRARSLGGNVDVGLGAAKQWGSVIAAVYGQVNLLKEVKDEKDFFIDIGPRAWLGYRIIDQIYINVETFYTRDIRSGSGFDWQSTAKVEGYWKRFGLRVESSLFAADSQSGLHLSYFY
jgi:hypothetical protein